MSCRPGCDDDFAGLLREARKAGVQVRLDRNGKLVMRAARKPPPALIEHLVEHAKEISEPLKRKAAAERAEARLTLHAKTTPSVSPAAIGFGICDRCGKPPTTGNELIAEGLTMTVHEKCYKGRGGRKPRFRPKTGGDGAVSDRDNLLVPDNRDELVPVPAEGRANDPPSTPFRVDAAAVLSASD
jgi:hypothetical protein